MLAFFGRQSRRWLVFAVAVPVTAWTVGWLAGELERTRGQSKITKSLRFAERQLATVGGPLGRRA